MDVSDTSRELLEYLRDIVELSPENIRVVKSSLAAIKEKAPSDVPLILNKIERLIDLSQDLSWIIIIMKRKLNELTKQMKIVKDPKYVMLVRQGRPSSAAIEAEIRFTDKNLYSLEDDIDTVKNIIEYFQKIIESMDKYSWLLKDKLGSDKM